MPFVRRTRATFRSAEFGFFGVTVKTRVQTPRFCGAPRSAGVFTFAFGAVRPFRTSWLTVGMGTPPEGLALHTTKAGGAHAVNRRAEAWARRTRGACAGPGPGSAGGRSRARRGGNSRVDLPRGQARSPFAA